MILLTWEVSRYTSSGWREKYMPREVGGRIASMIGPDARFRASLSTPSAERIPRRVR